MSALRKKAKSLGIPGYTRLTPSELESAIEHFEKYAGDPSLSINKYFDKIFIINLDDKTERWRKVSKQFYKKGVKFQRFSAVDGRTKKYKYAKKKRELEKQYGVEIPRNMKPPESSLVIGTIMLLREQVRKKWKRMLICEDDVILGRNIHTRFQRGIDELKGSEYDLLYLGCGDICGMRGISQEKTGKNKYISTIHEFIKSADWHVQKKEDLRVLPDEDEIKSMRWGKYISTAVNPGGTWAYSFTLSGAKKALKMIDNFVSDHIDKIMIGGINDGLLVARSFDPPIIWHEEGAFRKDTDIPWTW